MVLAGCLIKLSQSSKQTDPVNFCGGFFDLVNATGEFVLKCSSLRSTSKRPWAISKVDR